MKTWRISKSARCENTTHKEAMLEINHLSVKNNKLPPTLPPATVHLPPSKSEGRTPHFDIAFKVACFSLHPLNTEKATTKQKKERFPPPLISIFPFYTGSSSQDTRGQAPGKAGIFQEDPQLCVWPQFSLLCSLTPCFCSPLPYARPS